MLTSLDHQTHTLLTILHKSDDSFLCTFQGRLFRLFIDNSVEPLPSDVIIKGYPQCKPHCVRARSSTRHTLISHCEWFIKNMQGVFIAYMKPTVIYHAPTATWAVWTFVYIKRMQRLWRQALQARRVALCMGMHERLGKDSILQILPAELLNKLVS